MGEIQTSGRGVQPAGASPFSHPAGGMLAASGPRNLGGCSLRA
jgi:hypothetical protein